MTTDNPIYYAEPSLMLGRLVDEDDSDTLAENIELLETRLFTQDALQNIPVSEAVANECREELRRGEQVGYRES